MLRTVKGNQEHEGMQFQKWYFSFKKKKKINDNQLL